MRLELAAFPVRDVRFGAMTRWRDGVLEIDPDEVLEPVRRDPLVERAELAVARPGESIRIVTIQDIIRWRPLARVERTGSPASP